VVRRKVTAKKKREVGKVVGTATKQRKSRIGSIQGMRLEGEENFCTKCELKRTNTGPKREIDYSKKREKNGRAFLWLCREGGDSRSDVSISSLGGKSGTSGEKTEKRPIKAKGVLLQNG